MLVVVAIVGVASVAYAHGGEGLIEVGDPTTDELEVEIPVRITYEADGHAAEEVSGLSVSGSGPDGATFGPVEVFVPGDAPGVHNATVTLPSPGQWELTIDVSEPPATASLTVDVAGSGDVVDEPDADSSDGEGDDTVGSGAEDANGAAADPDDGDSESDGGIAIVAIAVGVAVVAAVVASRWSRNR